MTHFEFTTRTRTLPLPAATAAASDPETAATHPRDRPGLARLAAKGWELFDVQGDEYRLRRAVGPTDRPTADAAPADATPADAALADAPSSSNRADAHDDA